MKLIDKLAWIEIEDGKILSTRSYGKDKYYIPGGKREGDESDHEALIREIREELNVELEESSIQHVGNFKAQAHGQAEGVVVQMTCYSASYHGVLKPSAEVEELAWFTYRDREKGSAVDQIIFDWLFEKEKIDP